MYWQSQDSFASIPAKHLVDIPTCFFNVRVYFEWPSGERRMKASDIEALVLKLLQDIKASNRWLYD
jgi:hypothetical protein